MTRDDEHGSDPNENAARIVREATGTPEVAGSVDIERAWLEWSRGIQKVDKRAMSLLRAAFEAGWDSASRRD